MNSKTKNDNHSTATIATQPNKRIKIENNHSKKNVEEDFEIDMFADDFEEQLEKLPLTKQTKADDYDDEEGYYKYTPGEPIQHYQIYELLGRGVFGSVIRAKDLRTNQEVAIKVIRNNPVMFQAGKKEISILEKLTKQEHGQKHIIRLLNHFEYRNHLCLVFESMHMNLREVLKKFGLNKGLHIKAIQLYTQQLFLALSILKKCQIIHADIKPDNILVNETKSLLKLADLGSAGDLKDNPITPYLVSRFYRAPEIILGCPYDHALDIWSVGCTLFELFTGRVLFNGQSNNQMLKKIMQLRGRMPLKMLKRGQFTAMHFDLKHAKGEADIEFLEHSDSNTLTRVRIPQKPELELKSLILTQEEKKRLESIEKQSEREAEQKLIQDFTSFLDKCLMLNPEKRMTVSEALIHPFILSNMK